MFIVLRGTTFICTPTTWIAQFRIPGRTGASCVKLIKERLMRGRTESMRALRLVKHCCCALNCTISTQKTKNVEKYPERASVRCFPIVQDSEKKYYAAEIPEREWRMRWIATCSCRLDSLMLRGTPEYVQYISKEVLTRLNWILFPQYLHSDNIIGEKLPCTLMARSQLI